MRVECVLRYSRWLLSMSVRVMLTALYTSRVLCIMNSYVKLLVLPQSDQTSRENVSRKRPQLWRNNSWFLHRDNAPAHALLLILNFLANPNTTVLPQSPCSPDLAPADFLFPKRKSWISRCEIFLLPINLLSHKKIPMQELKQEYDVFSLYYVSLRAFSCKRHTPPPHMPHSDKFTAI
jgi:hypothetical protein